MNAGQQLDQRRFAGAVLADDRVNLALLEGQIDGLSGRGSRRSACRAFRRARSGALSVRAAVSSRGHGRARRVEGFMSLAGSSAAIRVTQASLASARKDLKTGARRRSARRAPIVTSLSGRAARCSFSPSMLALVIEVRAGVDEGRDLLALGDGERGLDAVIAHAIGVLQHERGDRAVLEEADQLVVGVEADRA